MKPTLPFVLFTLFAISLQAQTTIHIDPDYTGGTPDGTLEHPFTSWQEALPITSGNTYLQKRGTTCEVEYHMSLAPDVTIGAYGEGTRPIIENTAELSGNFGIFYMYNRDSNDPDYYLECRNIVIRDLEIRGNHVTSVLLFEGNVEDYVVENCILSGGIWGMRVLTWGNPDEDLITKQNERFGRILNNVIESCGEDGIFIGWTSIGLEIGYNVIDDVNRKYFGEYGGSSTSQYTAPGDPIQVTESAAKLWIHHNYLDKSDTQYKFALILQSTQDTLIPAIVEYNVMIGQGRDTAATVYLDGTYDIIFRGNVLSNSPSSIFQKSANLSNVQVYNNVFHNLSNAMYNEANVGAEFHNNTMLDCSGVVQASFSKRLSMMNNLMYTPETSNTSNYFIKNNQGTAPPEDRFELDYNLIYPAHAGMWIHLGVGYDSLGDWQNTGFGAHSLIADPLFVDPAAGDYRLQAGSPAVDAGVVIPEMTPEGDSNPDIGANMDEIYSTGVGPDGSISLAVTLMSATYGSFPLDGNGNFDTGDWMGWFSTTSTEGWIWSYSTGGYWYLTDENLTAGKDGSGVWAYLLK